MKRNVAITMAIIGWLALCVKLFLRIEIEEVPVYESVIRFFSYFTILTNTLVTIYFTTQVLYPKKETLFNKPETLTALAAFITLVGVAYHVLLRSLWNPTGLVMVLDEIHHTIVPIVTVLFWFFYIKKQNLEFKKTFIWVLYPVIYLFWALTRGKIASFYPYYFLDIDTLGFQKVLINSLGLLGALILFLGIFFFLGKRIKIPH